MNRKIYAADLFCGAGGTSTGLARACKKMGREVDLLAVNHWPEAIASHDANHPWARHLCQRVDAVQPLAVVPGGRLDILTASPECTHHSVARGGRPIQDQLRASPWHVLPWLQELRVESLLMENVREFESWGPLNSKKRPDQRRKGETFKGYLRAIESLGYTVDYKILNSANYGDATTRERLFIIARRGMGKRIAWPNHSHPKFKWRAAREIIDWDVKGASIFNRKRPLAANTLRRIAAGLKRFGGKKAEPFLVMLYGSNTVRSLERPLPTVTASGQHIALCQPFIVPFFGERQGQDPRTHSVEEPLPAVTSHGAGALVQPFITKFYGTGISKPVTQPLDTITTKDRFALVEPRLAEGGQLDITLRMLTPGELADAMSFGKEYKFSGSRADQVKQIGNAVPVRTAQALCTALLKATG